MKKLNLCLLFSLLFLVFNTCKKDEEQTIDEPTCDYNFYVEYTFNGNSFKEVGLINYSSVYQILNSTEGIGFAMEWGSSIWTSPECGSNADYILYIVYPNDSTHLPSTGNITGNKYQIVNDIYSLSQTSDLFKLYLEVTDKDGSEYVTLSNSSTSLFYHEITSFQYLGVVNGDYSLCEYVVQGIFRVNLSEKTDSTNIKAITDGKYKINIEMKRNP